MAEGLRRAAMRHVVVPVAVGIFRRDSLREYRMMRGLEHTPPAQLRARQEARLRRLIAWAYETVPYYRSTMDDARVRPEDITDQESLQRLPVLTKRDLQDRLPDFVSRRAGPGDLELKGTSGTTGTPLRFYRDRRVAPFGQATWWQALAWAGASPADPVMYWIMPRLPGDAVRLTFWKVLTGTRLLPYEPMINRNAEAVLSALAPVHDGILIAPPSYLQLLSRLIIDAGRERAVRPRVVFYNGEQMSDDIRKMTVRAFGAPIFSRYGANEFSAMVIQSCPHDGWHINTEGFIVEIVDGAPGDRQAHPASHGRILITDLRNAVAPFIRYEIGDIGWSTGQTACSCGRTSPVLGGLEGRAVEYLVTASGRRIPAVVFQRWLRVQVDCFWEYQLQQDRPGELEIRVVPRQTYTDAQAEALVAHLRQFLGDEVSVRVKAVEGIPREASGKRPLLKSTLRIP